MTETDVKVKSKKVSAGIKIELTKENSEAFTKLLSEANSIMRGFNLNYTNFGNWLFSHHSPNLSEGEIISLRQTFHSEKAFAKWMVEEIISAESEGRVPPTIEELLTQKTKIQKIVSHKKTRSAKNILKRENDPSGRSLETDLSCDQGPVPPSENDQTKRLS